MHGNAVPESMPESMPESYVYVTEEGVTRHYADGSVEALAWEDVVEVRVGGLADQRDHRDHRADHRADHRDHRADQSRDQRPDQHGDRHGDGHADVLIVLLDRDGEGCVVPRSATDASFLARLRYLPDFDLDRLSSAVEAASDGYVVVWRSPDPPSPLPDLEYD
ncbi:hypothetical protein [Microtetraspora sp. AC03309]|uniref:hypothetical protein n=1 Tax=Microtetraspora sp. AC03309 TaxID=2779376 RepID=UPI001E317269|nr:hypothetical protein [Microtetraspora sp. AC03309]